MKRSTLYALALLPQVLVLGGLVARSEHTLRLGRRVVLEVRAVDPMDLFVGRYVATPLAIEQVDLDDYSFDGTAIAPDSAIWVRLEEGEPWWTATNVAREPYDDGVWLRGTVQSASDVDGRHTARVSLGLDRYFIPEESEDPAGWVDGKPRQLALVVRVTPDGTAGIEDLLVDGASFADWSRAQRKR